MSRRIQLIVDTNVFVYALLGVTEHREEAYQVLLRCEKIVVPDLVRSELVNVCSKWVRQMNVDEQIAFDCLRDADGLFDSVVPADYLWNDALKLSLAFNHGAMDCLFIALAHQQDSKVVTYDGKLRAKFPEETVSPEEFLDK